MFKTIHDDIQSVLDRDPAARNVSFEELADAYREAAEGQVAGGANVLCFTTGRGSMFGAKPVPSIKLATNSDIYHRMIDDMDIDCGDILRECSRIVLAVELGLNHPGP